MGASKHALQQLVEALAGVKAEKARYWASISDAPLSEDGRKRMFAEHLQNREQWGVKLDDAYTNATRVLGWWTVDDGDRQHP